MASSKHYSSLKFNYESTWKAKRDDTGILRAVFYIKIEIEIGMYLCLPV